MCKIATFSFFFLSFSSNEIKKCFSKRFVNVRNIGVWLHNSNKILYICRSYKDDILLKS